MESMSWIKDSIRFCGEFELVLRRYDEPESSDNLRIFKALVNYTAAKRVKLHC